MSHDDEAGEDALARINLHAWRVPPPPAQDRSSILARALSPATPPRRSRTTWMFAAFAIANVVLAAIVAIVISRPAPHTTVTVQPAGGGSVDAQTADLLRRLEQDQRELERKLADVQQLRTVVEQLSERVRQCEQADRRDRPGPKPRRQDPEPLDLATCDEVSCVLTSYEGACCAKFRRPARAPSPSPSQSPSTNPSASALPDMLDRRMISAGIAAARAQVLACSQPASPRGTVKVRVRVSASGRVESVLVDSTPDPALGACVANVVAKTTFGRTHHGGSFSYPFVFGASP